MKSTPESPGKRLRRLRESLGLTLTEVERLTRELANHRRNPRLAIPRSRLSEIETRGRTPSIYTMHSLAFAYRSDIRKLLAIYGLK